MGRKIYALICALGVATFAIAGPRSIQRDPIGPAYRSTGDLSRQSSDAVGLLAVLDSHPLLVKPSWPIPVEFPLINGAIGCSTCHQWGSVNGSVGPLRVPHRGAEFCAQCHSQPGALAIAHASAVTYVHPTPREQVVDSLGGMLDAETKRCLSCHDGTMAGSMPDMNARIAPSIGGLRASHPMGVRQPNRRRPRGAKSKYTVRDYLPDYVRLYNERIGCGTCHNVYAKTRKHLVTERSTELCFACHDMR